MQGLIHYTSLARGMKILNDMSIRFGRIENSNDMYEREIKCDYDDDYFIFCTTKNEFNPLQWMAYGGSGERCALEFRLKDGCDDNNLFKSESNIESGMISYDEEYFEIIGEYPDGYGMHKDKRFEYENEYRYLLKIKKCADYYKSCELNLEALSYIKIYLLEKNKKIIETFREGLKNKFVKLNLNDFIRTEIIDVVDK